MINSPIFAPAIALVLWSLFMLGWLALTRLPAMARAGVALTTVVGARGVNLEGVLPARVNWKAHNYAHLMEQPTLFYATVVILGVIGELLTRGARSRSRRHDLGRGRPRLTMAYAWLKERRLALTFLDFRGPSRIGLREPLLHRRSSAIAINEEIRMFWLLLHARRMLVAALAAVIALPPMAFAQAPAKPAPVAISQQKVELLFVQNSTGIEYDKAKGTLRMKNIGRSTLFFTDRPVRMGARLDDAANFIPARLTAMIMILASAVAGLDYKNAFRIYRRDRKNHKSPNSAQTESVCAGALKVQLAGDASYFGQLVHKPTIGDPIRSIVPEDIIRANELMGVTAVIAVIFSLIARGLIQ